MPASQLTIRPATVVKALFAMTALLLLASMAGQTMAFVFGRDYIHGLVPLFYVDQERNIPTFFSVGIALGNALLLAVTGLAARERHDRDHGYWFALAAGFLFIAYDEAFQVHEKLIDPVRAMMGGKGELGLLYFAWVVPGIIGVCAMALLFRGFLMRLPRPTRNWLLLSAALYLGGCIGMELVGGAHVEAYGHDYAYTFIATIEEGLEMAGLVTLVHTLLGHLSGMAARVEFSLGATAQPQGALVRPTLA